MQYLASAGNVYSFGSAQLYSWQIIFDKHRMQTNSSFFTLSHLSLSPSLSVSCTRTCSILWPDSVSMCVCIKRLCVLSSWLLCAKNTCTHYKQGSIYYVCKTRDCDGIHTAIPAKWTHTKGAINVNQPNSTRVIYYYISTFSIYLFIRWLHSSVNLFASFVAARSKHANTHTVECLIRSLCDFSCRSSLAACVTATKNFDFCLVWHIFDSIPRKMSWTSFEADEAVNRESQQQNGTAKPHEGIGSNNKKRTELNRVSNGNSMNAMLRAMNTIDLYFCIHSIGTP